MLNNLNNKSIFKKYIVMMITIIFTGSLLQGYGSYRPGKIQTINQIDIVNLEMNNSGRDITVAPNETIKISFNYNVLSMDSVDYYMNNKQFVIGFMRRNMARNVKIIGEVNVLNLDKKQNNDGKIDDWQYNNQSYSNVHNNFDRKCFYNENRKHSVIIKDTP